MFLPYIAHLLAFALMHFVFVACFPALICILFCTAAILFAPSGPLLSVRSVCMRICSVGASVCLL